MHELLTPRQVAEADRLTVDAGIPEIDLMENAGQGVFEVLLQEFPEAKRVIVVCGTGNNGGDGFVVARKLAETGIAADVFVCGDPGKVGGAAKLALEQVSGSMFCNALPDFSEYDLIVDALLGAGLDRDVKGKYRDTIMAINKSNKPVLSIDLPSGIDGENGQICGCAVNATASVTFFRCKPGHMLFPGRQNCGKVHLCQIGISDDTLAATGFCACLNTPDLWRAKFPVPALSGHKYHRGHTLVISGPLRWAGASRLVANAALRVGSGLVTLASGADALQSHACQLTSVMICEAGTARQIEDLLKDPRMNCVALGSGMPADATTAKIVRRVLRKGRSVVLDAGAIVAFEEDRKGFLDAIAKSGTQAVMTPHEGEFARLFVKEALLSSKIDRALVAAKKSGAVIVLKGADTVVASPAGRVSVCNHAPPWLATAGSGDVLAGMVAGLVAQGMDGFEAGCAAVWLHADAANQLGPGVVSSDLDEGLRFSIGSLVRSLTASTR